MSVILEVIAGPLKGKRYCFSEPDTFIVGRAPDAHCQILNDDFISRHHFVLEVVPPEILIRDLGSLNGIFVNDRHYGGKTQKDLSRTKQNSAAIVLRHKDRIKIGSSEFLILIGNSIASPQPEVKNNLKPEDTTCPTTSLKPHAAGFSPPNVPAHTIVKAIGEGNMGKIFLGHNNHSGQAVAIKVMHPQKLLSKEAERKFEREINTTQSLNHPNIISYYDHGVIDNRIYLILEYAAGGGLEKLLEARGGKLKLREAAPIMLGSVAGLTYAHSKGIIHRDIKPSNILLSGSAPKRTAKLSDLGLAKSFQNAGLSGLTMTGDFGGSYGFMCKDQLTNFKYVNPVTDIFSLGATFYKMLTGKLCYDLSGFTSPLVMVIEGKIIPINERCQDIPGVLARVIDKSVQQDPNKRYASAGEFALALQDALQTAHNT